MFFYVLFIKKTHPHNNLLVYVLFRYLEMSEDVRQCSINSNGFAPNLGGATGQLPNYLAWYYRDTS